MTFNTGVNLEQSSAWQMNDLISIIQCGDSWRVTYELQRMNDCWEYEAAMTILLALGVSCARARSKKPKKSLMKGCKGKHTPTWNAQFMKTYPITEWGTCKFVRGRKLNNYSGISYMIPRSYPSNVYLPQGTSTYRTKLGMDHHALPLKT